MKLHCFIIISLIIIVETNLFAQDNLIKIPQKKLIELIYHWEGEPSIEEIQQAALKYDNCHPDDVDNLIAKMHWSTILPDISFKINKGLQRSESLDYPNLKRDQSYGIDTDDDFDISFSMDMDLSRFIFHPAEVKVRQHLQNLSERREKLLNTVTKLYFDRREIQINMKYNQYSPEETFEMIIKLTNLTAIINGMTGGVYRENFIENF